MKLTGVSDSFYLQVDISSCDLSLMYCANSFFPHFCRFVIFLRVLVFMCYLFSMFYCSFFVCSGFLNTEKKEYGP